jgi:hypothetical protein
MQFWKYEREEFSEPEHIGKGVVHQNRRHHLFFLVHSDLEENYLDPVGKANVNDFLNVPLGRILCEGVWVSQAMPGAELTEYSEIRESLRDHRPWMLRYDFIEMASGKWNEIYHPTAVEGKLRREAEEFAPEFDMAEFFGGPGFPISQYGKG